MLFIIVIQYFFVYIICKSIPSLPFDKNNLEKFQDYSQLSLQKINLQPDGTLDLNKINKCQDIWDHPDPCQYSKQFCSDLTEGFIDYTSLYYCNLKPVTGSIFGGITLAFILFLAFLFLTTIASDFFCPNLSTLANYFNLSESVAGVTLLAFGNGSPDLFSTFSAIKSGSGALAVGELIGASWFIISVVVGSMAIISSFHVVRQLFLRDLLFFTGAMIFMIFILSDRQLTPLESLFLISYYVFYVFWVVTYKPPEEFSSETTQLLSERSLSKMERIPITAPSTYYKRMNFWSIDEISRAVMLGTGDLHPGSIHLVRRGSKFLPASAKLSIQLSQENPSTSNSKRTRSYSSDIVAGSNSNQHQDYLAFDHENLGINSPIVTGLTIETRKNDHLIPTNITVQSPVVEDFENDNSFLKNIFPSLYDWQTLNHSEQFLNLICAPIIFVLTLTVPTPSDNEIDFSQEQTPTNGITISVPVTSKENNPGLTLLKFQAFTIPIFLFEVVSSYKLVKRYEIYWAFIVGSVLLFFINYFFNTRSRQENLLYKNPLIFSIIGFSLSICWISLVATEVVDILRAIGIILGINEEIIGLTIFAMGNSLGDFVANLSVARMGYPTMALSACFASPMLNLMLGTGLSGAYIGISSGEPLYIPITRVMIFAALGALFTLILYIIYVHINKFCIGKKFGFTLICLYLVGMTLSIYITE